MSATRTLLRAGSFFVFASAYWALLPLIARQQLGGGPAYYGLLRHEWTRRSELSR